MLELMSPPMRQRLLGQMLRNLRARNVKRIRAQQGPDGTAWQARKAQPKGRAKRGGKMLTGMARLRHLKTAVNSEAGELGYSGGAAFLANIHHHGMLDNVSAKGPKVQYPARPLLGISQADIDMISNQLLNHFSRV